MISNYLHWSNGYNIVIPVGKLGYTVSYCSFMINNESSYESNQSHMLSFSNFAFGV